MLWRDWLKLVGGVIIGYIVCHWKKKHCCPAPFLSFAEQLLFWPSCCSFVQGLLCIPQCLPFVEWTCEISNATDIRTDRMNNCETANVIYGLKCAECYKIVYVGETERSAGERFKEHIADIRHWREKTVAAHYNSGNHIIQDLKVFFLERCRNNSMFYRKKNRPAAETLKLSN